MRVRCWSLMLTEAFTFVDDERSAVSCWRLGCWAVFVEPLPAGDCCAAGGGLADCV
jgi:hypothetical protein